MRRFQAEKCRPRRLAQARVRSGRLADNVGFALDIENIVLDLECEPDLASKGVQRSRPIRVDPVLQQASCGDRGVDQRAGLQRVHMLELRDAERRAFCREVD